MGLINEINGLNDGRGVRGLTDAGVEERDRLVRQEKRARHIHHGKNVRGEPWYAEIEARLFVPENEGKFWVWARLR